MPGVRVVDMGSSCKVGGAFSKGLVTPGKLSTNGFLIRRWLGRDELQRDARAREHAERNHPPVTPAICR
jgi:hypothetical protein